MSRAPRRPGVRWRRRSALVVAMVVASACLTVIGVSSPTSLSVAEAGAAAACQSDGSGGCTTTLPCASGACPTVDATPVSDLTDGQFIYVKASHFPTGDTMRVAICSTQYSPSLDPADPNCLNGLWEADYWSPTQVPIAQDPAHANLTEVSLPAFYDQSGGGDSPLPSHDVLNANGVGSGFFCDNTNNPCALEVTEEVGTGVGDGPPDTNANTAIFPLTFQAQSSGCPSTDGKVDTASSFSLEHFLPTAVDATCAGAGGVVALNTATDNLSAVTDLTTSGSEVAFIDDPGDPQVQALLAKKSYTYIPIAVSATVVGFLAGQNFEGQIPYPLSEYNLTPNMVSGLITSEYQTPDGSPEQVGSQEVPGESDNLIPPLNCADLFECPNNQGLQVYNEMSYNTFALLNPSTTNVIGPQEFGSFMSNVSTGSSYQVTNWICKAPNAPITVSVDEKTTPHGAFHMVSQKLTDSHVAGTTLTTPPNGTSIWPPYTTKAQPDGPAWVFPTCQGYSTFPALASEETDYSESQNPAFQAKSIRSFAYQGSVVPQLTNVPYAGFGVMDSSEADFNGLNSANLQNADGHFVYPSTANIESAANQATPCAAGQATCPPGTYDINYAATANSSSYPMPDVTYAVVSSQKQPTAAGETSLKDLLTNLVTYSHGSSLPEGYAPLTTALYQAAVKDIANLGVTPPKAKAPTSATTTTGTTGTSGGLNGAGGSGGSPGSGTARVRLPATAPAKAHSGKGGSTQTHGKPFPSFVALLGLDEASRYLLPFLLLLAGLCLIAGPLLYFLPALRRRRRKTGGLQVESE